MSLIFSQLKKISCYAAIFLLIGNFILVEASSAKLYKGMQAPSFNLTDLNGNSEALSHLNTGKKLTVIVFWTTWNEQSAKELKRLQELYNKYKSKGFQVIAVNVENQAFSEKYLGKISAYCEEKGITFPVLIDHNLETYYKYSIITIPTTFLINAEATIVYKLPGYPIAGSEQFFNYIKETVEPQLKKIILDRQKLETPDKKAILHFNMARILQKRGNISSAIESFRKTISIDPSFLAAQNQLGVLLYKEGKKEEAVEVFDQVLAGNPSDISFLVDYGNFLFGIGNKEKALEIINKVLVQDPDYSAAHYFLGVYFLKQGQQKKALKEARTAVNLNPFDPYGQRLLGSIYESMDKKSMALDAYKKAAKLLEKKSRFKDLLFFSLVLDINSI